MSFSFKVEKTLKGALGRSGVITTPHGQIKTPAFIPVGTKATLIVAGKTTTGVCVDVFDGDNGMEGAPQEPLAAGKSISFNWGLSCDGKSGEDLSLILSNEGVAIIEVTGKLA